MNYSYNAQADALYIQVTDSQRVDHTQELADGVVVDLAVDGTLLGIDVMAASCGWMRTPSLNSSHSMSWMPIFFFSCRRFRGRR